MVTKRKRTDEVKKKASEAPAGAGAGAPAGAGAAAGAPAAKPKVKAKPTGRPTVAGKPVAKPRVKAAADADKGAVAPVSAAGTPAPTAPVATKSAGKAKPTSRPTVAHKPVAKPKPKPAAKVAPAPKRKPKPKAAEAPASHTAAAEIAPAPEAALSGADPTSATPAATPATVTATPAVTPALKRRIRLGLLVGTGVILAVCVLVIGLFSWDRWLRYDDAAEFQGQWQPHGSTATVVIDGRVMRLSPDVSYTYTLDTAAKTIAFTFGDMQGKGRYRFSLDRSQLVITDGEGYTWVSTLMSDAGWMADQTWRSLQGQPPEQVEPREGVTVLDRVSDDVNADPTGGVAPAEGPAEGQDEESESSEPQSLAGIGEGVAAQNSSPGTV